MATTSKTKKRSRPRYKRTDIELANITIAVYASPRVANALEELMDDMTLYNGVRLAQVMQAVFETGKKKGREEVFASIEGVKKVLPYRPPGQPKKKTKK
jgi:hypothetical protein